VKEAQSTYEQGLGQLLGEDRRVRRQDASAGFELRVPPADDRHFVETGLPVVLDHRHIVVEKIVQGRPGGVS